MVCGEEIIDNMEQREHTADSQREILRKTKLNIVNFMNLRGRSVKVKFIFIRLI